MKNIFLFAITAFCFASAARPGVIELVKDGVYWVPVAPEHIQYAMFFVPKVEVKNFGDRIKVEYDLPVELTGVATRIELEGQAAPNASMTLAGPHATAQCPRSGQISQCAISYKNLTFDQVARQSMLASISQSPAELASRIAVAERFQFGGEPGGFLSLNY